MKMLWRDTWIDAPRPAAVDGAELIEVEATVPIAPLGIAHGRIFTSPLRKVLSFGFTDGPIAARRKARSKRAESAFTGDYHLVAVLGTSAGRRVAAVAPRAPRCAGWMLVHSDFTFDVEPSFGTEELKALAARAGDGLDRFDGVELMQSYLHSGMRPPPELVAHFEAALNGGRTRPGSLAVLTPPAAAADDESIAIPSAEPRGDAPAMAMLGAGDYVRIEIAPALTGAALDRAVLCDREPQIAALAAARLGFAEATTDPRRAIDGLTGRGIVIVATNHDSHASLAVQALEAGHRVFLEKPAVVTVEDLDMLEAAAEAHPGELEVGFNRRYNPLVRASRKRMEAESGPSTILGVVREVDIEPDHWYLWANQGTRVAGNLCHWIDQAFYLLGPSPEAVEVSVSPRVSSEPTGIDAERAFSIGFDDESAVTLMMTGRGDAVRGVQEQMEVRRGELTFWLDDLWKLRGLREGRPFNRRTLWRDKSHGPMYAEALTRFERGEPATYPLSDLRRVGDVQIALTELLISGGSAGTVAELVERARERSAGG